MKNKFFETELKDGICIVWLDQQDSKVNKIGPEMVGMFEPLLDEIESNASIQAAVLISRKKDFIAGADIEAFANVKKIGDWQPIGSKGHAILHRIERSAKPIVAAIQGACMGAGTEIALACTARIAADDGTVLALPEVKLGLLPGGGGTQRLPRLVGIQKSLDMMLNGKNIYPYPAKKMGLIDRLATQPALLNAALFFAKELIKQPLRRKDQRSLLSRVLEGNPITRGIIFKKASQLVNQQTHGNYPAPFEIIECVRTGIEKGNEAGYAEEIRRFERLIMSPESLQLRHLFFASTEKKKNPQKAIAKPVQQIGILGAGFMGAGIAEVTVPKDIRVVLKDIKQATLSQAKHSLWSSLKTKLQRKSISEWEANQQLNRVTTQLDFAHFDKLQLVIEAVFEEIELKKKVLIECEQHLSDSAIYASNTSALPISEIAAASQRPDQVVGMHYFSPVPKMPLLEIVKTDQTADWVVATCYEVGLAQGKVVIVVNDGPGFYTTRILAPMMGEALNLLDEGADILQVDRALTKFGFPVGPFTLMDEVGIDVGAHIMSGKLVKHIEATRQGVKMSIGLLKMFQAGYSGRKNRKGFYQYDKKGNKVKGQANPQAYQFFAASARKPFDDGEIVQRVSWSFISEALRCLQEEIIENPLDGDIGAVFGLGFPPHLGGPFRYVDSVGVESCIQILTKLSQSHGLRFEAPSILREYAHRNAKFYPSAWAR
jgi:3-hydroxyacyl-CoA dehydrogenase / enoyl-CoA hydratase / 3-hydroxybutyryl-CoA epimerase